MSDNNNSNKTNLYPPASLFKRLAALIYDSFVVFSFLILMTTLALLCNQGRSLLPYKSYFLMYLLLTTGFFLTWFWRQGGQTLGMLAWKIKVLNKSNQPLTGKQAILRYCLSLFSVCGGGLGLLWCLIDKEGQSLHDRLSGTKVVSLSNSPEKKQTRC